jgi:hypothetical protein
MVKLPNLRNVIGSNRNSRRFSETAGASGPGMKLNARTLEGYVLTGKFIDVKELQSGQFSERPLNQYSDRLAAPPFAEMVKAHREDGDIAFALDLHTAVIAGRGFHIKAANERIKDYVLDFANDFQMGEFIKIAVMETLGYGSSFYRYLDRRNFIDIEWLPISSVRGINWSKDGRLLNYQFNAANYKDSAIPADEILHLRWRRIDSSFFGFGLIEPLISSRSYDVLRDGQWKTRQRPPVMSIKPEMQDVGRKVLRRYIPRHLIAMKGADDAEVTQARKDLKILEPEEDIITAAEATLQELGKGVKAIDWDSWEKLFRNEIITTLENPAIRIFTEPGFTKANADAALDSVKLLLQGFADSLAWEFTNVIIKAWYEADSYVNANGEKVKWRDAKIEFCWGVQEKPVLELKDLIEIGRISATTPMRVLKPSELRRNLRNMANLDLDADDDVESEFLQIAEKEKLGAWPPFPQPQKQEEN